MKPRRVKTGYGTYGSYGRTMPPLRNRRRPPARYKRLLARVPVRYIVLAVAGLALVIILAHVFAVRSVQVTPAGSSAEISQAVTELTRAHWRQGNLLTIDTAALVAALRERQPAVKAATVHRAWPGTLRVAVTLKQPSLGWESGNQRYLLDHDGSIIGPLVAGTAVPVVSDRQNLPVTLGQQVTTARFVDFVLAATQGLKAQGLAVTKLEVKDTTLDLYATTGKGYYVLLDTSRPAADELADLTTVLKALAAQKRTPVEYIDLRIAGKAYYK